MGKTIKSVIMSLFIITSMNVFARDITKQYTDTSINPTSSTEVLVEPTYLLQAIKTGSTNKAMINNIWFKKGERFQELYIVNISSKQVKIKVNGEIKVLKIE